ncbi:hypothetical protein GMST_20610 [Geomonas silvestris]|uniref:Uncharacterized protein n=1 Tax=Geomonas silvestris TaxID=2740184 RepID=A0A6V8MIF6_9BACT|nr:hypothetical protein GMST_20610 [Geomonas silvestris]
MAPRVDPGNQLLQVFLQRLELIGKLPQARQLLLGEAHKEPLYLAHSVVPVRAEFLHTCPTYSNKKGHTGG